IPRTPNGKVDYEALAAIEDETENYIAPANDVERKILELWSDILKLESGDISTADNFFALGGNSLNIMNLISRMHREFDVRIPLGDIFNSPAIQLQAKLIAAAQPGKYASMEPAEEREYYPLSPAQMRLYLLHQMDIQGIGYNMPQALQLQGYIDRSQLDGTFHRLIQRHESFRTSFMMVNGIPVQRVHPPDEINFQVDYRQLEAKAAGEIIDNVSQPFDLSRSPLLRLILIETGDQEYLMALDMHHIVSDGVSSGILVRDFMSLYEGKELSRQTFHYKDFAIWRNSPAGKENVNRRQNYWLERLTGDIPVLNLPTDYARPPVQRFEGETAPFDLEKTTGLMLNELALNEGGSVFMVVLAIFNLLLSKVSGSKDVVVGTGTEGRGFEELREIIGMFVNTLALRNFPRPSRTFREFLAELKNHTLEDFENQDYPFEDIVENLGVKRDTGRNPVFDVMFQFNNFEVPELAVPGLTLKPYWYRRKISKFDLTLWCRERGDQLGFAFEYSTSLFKRQTIDIFIRYFKEIADAVVRNPREQLGLLQQISLENKEQLLRTVNQDIDAEIKRMAGLEQVLQHRLDRSFRKFEHQIAIEYGDHALTYGELDRRSGRVTRQIIARGIRKGDFVGILMDDRITLITTVLGIIKAGAVFVPLDTSYPHSRLQLMIGNTGTKLIVADHPPVDSFNVDGWFNVEALADSPDVELPGIQYQPGDRLYIYFTSGSTGTPKAILGKNRSLVHFIDWEIHAFGIDAGYRFSQLTSPGFDAFLRDLFVPLTSGGTVCIPPNKDIQLEGTALLPWLEYSRIHLISCVPGLFRLLASQPLTPDNLKQLRVILLSGERTHAADLEEWFDTFNGRIQTVNLWGTSETTLAKTYHIITKADLKRERIPVGKPIPGASVLVLDETMELCDSLVTGRLYIGTPYRSFGYYNDPRSNSTHFIPNPFGSGPEDLLHHTGDMGRILSDGTIDLLGRNDRQVKLRGIRIELEEIEAVLIAHPRVNEAVVIKRGQVSNEILCACFTHSTEQALSGAGGESFTEVIGQYLREKLPAYMVPSLILDIGNIPRTPNGKVDYEALAAIEDETENYIAPANDVERKILELWSDILKLES
ncbi:MAG: amino acid adenylation domain-containing protein, partial [bacterium]|nr:amino acid adenylation domain-containing protein [bacterium]